MSLPKAVLSCPHCKESGDHRVHTYGDGTAVVWCGTCHNPREMLLAQLLSGEVMRRVGGDAAE